MSTSICRTAPRLVVSLMLVGLSHAALAQPASGSAFKNLREVAENNYAYAKDEAFDAYQAARDECLTQASEAAEQACRTQAKAQYDAQLAEAKQTLHGALATAETAGAVVSAD